MTRACRPLTAWRRLAAPLCAAALLVPAPAAADTCSGLAFGTQSARGDGNRARRRRGRRLQPRREGRRGDGQHGRQQHQPPARQRLGRADAITFSTGAGANPIDVVAGDLDRDGFLDLVVAKSTGQDLELLRGTGTSFVTQTAFDAGSTPTRLALGDFNRDGRPDLVVVSEAGNRVAVFRGNGTVGFGPSLADVTVSAPVAAVAADSRPRRRPRPRRRRPDGRSGGRLPQRRTGRAVGRSHRGRGRRPRGRGRRRLQP